MLCRLLRAGFSSPISAPRGLRDSKWVDSAQLFWSRRAQKGREDARKEAVDSGFLEVSDIHRGRLTSRRRDAMIA